MRSEDQIFELIRSVAQKDERIRCVMLNGSRVNKNIGKDHLQDFDIVYFVKDLDSFARTPNWIDVFGKRIILQKPNSMNLHENNTPLKEESIVYLMLFQDHNRIDLSLRKLEDRHKKNDSLSKILLDKDQLFKEIPTPNDKDYWLKKPSQTKFSDTCNEFWWVSTYVVKGLLRDEIIYAKDIQETILRKMFMNIIAWNLAADFDFRINLGVNYKLIKKYLAAHTMKQIQTTYSDFAKANIWKGFMLMSTIFHEQSIALANKISFDYNTEEAENVKKYIQAMKNKGLN